MTYQFITLDMIQKAKNNGGFIDQTLFKTNEKYTFDTLIIGDNEMQILESYIKTTVESNLRLFISLYHRTAI